MSVSLVLGFSKLQVMVEHSQFTNRFLLALKAGAQASAKLFYLFTLFIGRFFFLAFAPFARVPLETRIFPIAQVFRVAPMVTEALF